MNSSGPIDMSAFPGQDRVRFVERIKEVPRYIRSDSGGTTWIFAIVLLVILLAGIGVGIFFLVRALKKNDKDDEDKTTNPVAAPAAPIAAAPIATPLPPNVTVVAPPPVTAPVAPAIPSSQPSMTSAPATAPSASILPAKSIPITSSSPTQFKQQVITSPTAKKIIPTLSRPKSAIKSKDPAAMTVTDAMPSLSGASTTTSTPMPTSGSAPAPVTGSSTLLPLPAKVSGKKTPQTKSTPLPAPAAPPVAKVPNLPAPGPGMPTKTVKKKSKKAKKAKKSKKPKKSKTPSASASSSSSSSGGGGNIPTYVLQRVGLDAEQLSNILSIIGGAEQSSVEWWKEEKGGSVFGYCDDISDGRGATLGIAGFTTKDGSADAVFQNYGTSRQSVGSDSNCKKGACPLCQWVKAKGNDPKFIDAQWKAYLDGKDSGYLGMAIKYRPSYIKSALATGLLIDASMNAGEEKEDNAWGVKECAAAATAAAKDEKGWCQAFINARIAHFTDNSGSGKGRMSPWKALLDAGKLDMKGINICQYTWCYENQLGKGCSGCK